MQLLKDLWAVVQALLQVVKTLVSYVRAVILAVETLIGKLAHKKEVAPVVSAPAVTPTGPLPVPTASPARVGRPPTTPSPTSEHSSRSSSAERFWCGRNAAPEPFGRVRA